MKEEILLWIILLIWFYLIIVFIRITLIYLILEKMGKKDFIAKKFYWKYKNMKRIHESNSFKIHFEKEDGK